MKSILSDCTIKLHSIKTIISKMLYPVLCLLLLQVVIVGVSLAQQELEPDVEIALPFSTAVQFSPDGTQLAIGHAGLFLYDATTGDSLRQYGPRPSNLFQSLRWSSDGERIVSTSSVAESIVWDLESGERLLLGADSVKYIYSCAWSQSGQIVATGGVDRIVREQTLLHR